MTSRIRIRQPDSVTLDLMLKMSIMLEIYTLPRGCQVFYFLSPLISPPPHPLTLPERDLLHVPYSYPPGGRSFSSDK